MTLCISLDLHAIQELVYEIIWTNLLDSTSNLKEWDLGLVNQLFCQYLPETLGIQSLDSNHPLLYLFLKFAFLNHLCAVRVFSTLISTFRGWDRLPWLTSLDQQLPIIFVPIYNQRFILRLVILLNQVIRSLLSQDYFGPPDLTQLNFSQTNYLRFLFNQLIFTESLILYSLIPLKPNLHLIHLYWLNHRRQLPPSSDIYKPNKYPSSISTAKPLFLELISSSDQSDLLIRLQF